MICTPKVCLTFGVHITIAWFFFISKIRDTHWVSLIYGAEGGTAPLAAHPAGQFSIVHFA